MEKPAIEKGQAIEFGLTQIDFQLLQDTFAKFPELKEAILFGSRAKKTFRKGSDIDIALIGNNVSHDTIRQIDFILNEELPLPYHFDLLNFQKTENQDLLNHINRVGIRIY